MSSFLGSPKRIKAGLVVLDSASGAAKRTITLQYNPDTLTRSYQVQGAGGDGGAERAQPFRVKGPAIESIKLDAEIDATDSLEHPDQNANAVAFGIAPQLAALESLVNPSTRELLAVNPLAYTVGQDVVFGAGQNAPGSHAGRQLLAHELTYVVQQSGRLAARHAGCSRTS